MRSALLSQVVKVEVDRNNYMEFMWRIICKDGRIFSVCFYFRYNIINKYIAGNREILLISYIDH